MLIAGAAFDAIQCTSLVGSGTGNLAVAVQEGSGNQTGIVQRGTDNRTGIRIVRSDNAMNLVRTGDDNVTSTTLPVNAEMNGNGIEMTIRQDDFGSLSLE